MSSYNPFFYVLLCHTSNKVTVLLVLKLHNLLFSNFLVVVLVSCMFLLFVLFCLSGVFLESSAGSYIPSVASSPQTAVSAFSQSCFSLASCLSFSCLSASSITQSICLVCFHSSLSCSSFANTSSSNICFHFSSSHDFCSSASCLLLKSSLILFS